MTLQDVKRLALAIQKRRGTYMAARFCKSQGLEAHVALNILTRGQV